MASLLWHNMSELAFTLAGVHMLWPGYSRANDAAVVHSRISCTSCTLKLMFSHGEVAEEPATHLRGTRMMASHAICTPHWINLLVSVNSRCAVNMGNKLTLTLTLTSSIQIWDTCIASEVAAMSPQARESGHHWL